MARDDHLTPTAATGEAEAPDVEADRMSAPVLLAVLIGAAGLLATAAAVTRGFDLSDEGSYWWASAHPDRLVNSATQYFRLTGPIFAVLGWNIALVRLARLVLVVAATGFLAGVVVRWLVAAGVEVSREARAALSAIVVVAPLGASIWLPQTLAYNDLVLVELLLIGGASGRAVLSTDRRRAWAWAATAGAVVWAVAMTKFSAAGAVAVMAIGMTVGCPASARTWRSRAELLGAHLGGFLAGAGLWHLSIMGLGETWAGFRVGFEDAARSHGAGSLLDTYRLDIQTLGVLGLITIGTVILGRWVRSSLALAVWAITVVWLVLEVPIDSPRLLVDRPFDRSLLGPLLVAGTVVWRGPSIMALRIPLTLPQRRRLALFVTLGVLPLLAAIGTANSLLVGAINMAPFWTLAGFVALVGSVRARVAPAAVFAVIVALLYSWFGVLGTWTVPYRQAPLINATASVPGVDRFDGMRLEPGLAESIASVENAVSHYAGPGHHWMLPFWRLPGLAYATGSDIPEFIWAPDAVERNLRAIETACADDDPLVVVTADALDSIYVRALSRACGAPFPDGWDQLGTVSVGGGQVTLTGVRGTR